MVSSAVMSAPGLCLFLRQTTSRGFKTQWFFIPVIKFIEHKQKQRKKLKAKLNGWLPLDKSQYTTALQGAHEPRRYRFHPLVNPIYTSATFRQRAPGEDYGYKYSRIANPTRDSLEKVLAKLDDAAFAASFPSGMNAIYAVLKMLAPDDHIVCSQFVFDGTYRYVDKHNGVEFQATFVNPTVEEYVAAIRPNTKMVYVESPSNPMLKVTDIPRLVRAVKSMNSEIIIVMDNTFLTPFYQKGLKLGADIVVYSLSKYMNGHADVIMGAVITNNQFIHEYMLDRQRFSGMLTGPFDCYQVLRGLKTLPIRMLQHWKNALRVALWLESNPYVERVNYPGLRSQSTLPRTMWSGVSGMLSFWLKNFSGNMTRDFLGNLQHFNVAWSLGAVESLAEQPSVMLDISYPEEFREKLGVTPNLVRLSIGLEYYQDLIDDIDQALKAVSPYGPPGNMDNRGVYDGPMDSVSEEFNPYERYSGQNNYRIPKRKTSFDPFMMGNNRNDTGDSYFFPQAGGMGSDRGQKRGKASQMNGNFPWII